MAQKVTLKISAEAARFVRPEASKELKLQAASGVFPLAAADLAAVLFSLAHSPDPDIKGAALKRLREAPEKELLEMAAVEPLHPAIIDLLAKLHFMKPAVAERLAGNSGAEEPTLLFLAEKGVEAALEHLVPEGAGEGLEEEEDMEVDEESEQFRSKYQLYQTMGVGEKIKVAMTGDKEWRNLLIKDTNKLVSGAAIKNPRITESEVLTIAKSKVQNDEILRVICMNKEWVKNYQIKKALVENSKTPLHNALRFMSTLTEKDMAALAKSKNVSTVIATQARKLLATKEKK